MKLIYAYIGEFRNIYKQSFCFDRRYEVELIEQEPDHYRIEIKDNKEYINIMKFVLLIPYIAPPCIEQKKPEKHLDGICVFAYYKGNIVFLN